MTITPDRTPDAPRTAPSPDLPHPRGRPRRRARAARLRARRLGRDADLRRPGDLPRPDRPARAGRSSTRRSTCCSSRPWPTGWSRCSSSSTRADERLADRLLDALGAAFAAAGIRVVGSAAGRRCAGGSCPACPGGPLRRAAPPVPGPVGARRARGDPRSREELADRLGPHRVRGGRRRGGTRPGCRPTTRPRWSVSVWRALERRALRRRRPRRGAAGHARRRPCGTRRGAR